MNEFLCAPRPIRSVLIANRGEIACRIIATCRKLGLRTVAVHSDADAGARHVALADKAERIGTNAPSQSYLNIDAILEAAKRSGADAIHPGYGFLSENAEFSRACAENGLIFIGPAPDAVAAMGSKIEARRIAEAAGLPIVPGYQATDAGLEDFAQAADRIGFPILIVMFAIEAATAPFLFLGRLPGAIAGMALWGISMGTQESIMRAAVADLIPADRRATGFGLFHMIFGVAWFSGSALLGLLYQRDVRAMVAFAVGIQLLAVPVAFLANSARKRGPAITA